MKATIKVEKEFDIKYLQVKAQVRYWEDATVNGVEDTEGTYIPCRDGDLWCPKIDVDSGKIIKWKQGIQAEVHYKVCDAGSYYLEDENGNEIISIVDDYVPSCMYPQENGFGDYIIMHIMPDGYIKNWQFNKSHLMDFTRI